MTNVDLMAVAKALDENPSWENILPGQLGRRLAKHFIESNPANAPDWYCREEIHHWLKQNNYCDQIADELAGLVANNMQLAFNKGFEMGQRKSEVRHGER